MLHIRVGAWTKRVITGGEKEESKLGDFGDSIHVREEPSRVIYVFLALVILWMVMPSKELKDKGGEVFPKRNICEF